MKLIRAASALAIFVLAPIVSEAAVLDFKNVQHLSFDMPSPDRVTGGTFRNKGFFVDWYGWGDFLSPGEIGSDARSLTYVSDSGGCCGSSGGLIIRRPLGRSFSFVGLSDVYSTTGTLVQVFLDSIPIFQSIKPIVENLKIQATKSDGSVVEEFISSFGSGVVEEGVEITNLDFDRGGSEGFTADIFLSKGLRQKFSGIVNLQLTIDSDPATNLRDLYRGALLYVESTEGKAGLPEPLRDVPEICFVMGHCILPGFGELSFVAESYTKNWSSAMNPGGIHVRSGRVFQPSPVPLPASSLMLFAGLLMVFSLKKWRKGTKLTKTN